MSWTLSGSLKARAEDLGASAKTEPDTHPNNRRFDPIRQARVEAPDCAIADAVLYRKFVGWKNYRVGC